MAGNDHSLYIQDDELKHLEQDTFGHKHIANAIVQSIINTKPPYIIGIFGGWGTGKSSLLTMIKSNLPKKKIATVTIDAWRYSSTGNLRRAFLVHVANELSKSMLGELRRRLYTTEQETSQKEKSKFEKSNAINWSNLSNILTTFMWVTLLFSGFLFIAFSLKTVIQFGLTREFFIKFQWIAFVNKFIDLAFVPFLLTLVNYLSFYIVQRPVTITQERIDADELFSYYFQKIIEQVTKKKKQLVIFIDNLDRLNDDKMVEALESIKAYINNENCVFVVACDDNVVRSVVNASPIIPRIDDSSGRKAGEHYLDKFFQQTFRLPEYMGINLHDFAMQNFATTRLYWELKDKGIDIRDVLSIILPTDVSSPRKVKRLINEFIALYEIVRRRENEEEGQLRPGQLTNAVHFLGKFSTLRAEYPEFYQILTTDSGLLERITQTFLNNEDTAVSLIQDKKLSNQKSLLAYLRKTRTINPDDLNAFIWLSQDFLTLGLPGSEVNLLRTSLADGNIEQVKAMFDKAEDDAKRTLLARVASRMVEQRLVGIDQQNGIRILAYLLPKFDDSISSEIAHITVTLMTQMDAFTAREILNVLRFAQRGAIDTQRQSLIDQILRKLDEKESRIKTFEAIFGNADVVEEKRFTTRVQQKLAEILKPESQTIPSASVDVEINAQIAVNQEFANWLISQATTYSDNDFVIDKYFSNDLVDYMVSRLSGKDFNLEPLYIDDQPLGENIGKALNVVAARILKGVTNSNYWFGLLRLLESIDILDTTYVFDKSSELALFVPEDLVEEFISGAFLSIKSLGQLTDDNKIENAELAQLLEKVIGLTFQLRRNKAEKLDNQKLEALSSSMSILLTQDFLRERLLTFVETFAKEFGANDADIFITSTLNAIADPVDNSELESTLISKCFELEDYLGQHHRDQIVHKVNGYIKSNDQSKIELALPLIEKLGQISVYKEPVRNYQPEWLAMLGVDAVTLLQAKIQLFEMLIEYDLLHADQFVEKIISLLPFGGDQERLQIVFNSVAKEEEHLSVDVGKSLFSALLAHIESLSTQISRALGIASTWKESIDDEVERTSFDSVVLKYYKSTPDEHLPILSISWKGLTVEQIQDHLIQIYQIEMGEKLTNARDLMLINALEAVDIEDRQKVVTFIWEKLINDRDAAESFMSVAKEFLALEDINTMRQISIDFIKENTNPQQNEINLRFLAATIRNDTRNIMPVVDMFVDMFGRAPEEVQLALKYIVECLKPFGLRDDHKGKLAQAMRKIPVQNDEELSIIKEKAIQIDLRWFKHDSEKNWWQ
ncbi:MAG: P-loop NTPase fold protein [Chloroflexota bacterium]